MSNPTLKRLPYQKPSPEAIEAANRIKDAGRALIDEIGVIGETRETEIAVQRAQEAVFWAVHSVTA